ncbi:SdpI family protein [Limosilactobacillus reuteri]|uniref:SdpI family protein n=2 Tax=Limosilactobacillus TaxID=2742598 RepID=UPI003A94492C
MPGLDISIFLRVHLLKIDPIMNWFQSIFFIKVPWTLNSQENWNRTHRLAAWVFVIAGLILILNAFLQQFWLITVVISCIIVLPVGYSFLLYRKGI